MSSVVQFGAFAVFWLVLVETLRLLSDAFGGPTRRLSPELAADDTETAREPDVVDGAEPQDLPGADLRDSQVSVPHDLPGDGPQDLPTLAADAWRGDPPGPDDRDLTAGPVLVVLRRPWRLAWLMLFLLAAGLTIRYGLTNWGPWYDRGGVFIVLGAVLAMLGVLQLRIRVGADPDGVVVVNLFRTHRLSWSRIETVDYADIDIGGRTSFERVRFRVPEGDVAAQATAPWFAGLVKVPQPLREFVEQLRVVQDAASQPSDGDPTGQAHRVPTFRPWQRWAIGLSITAGISFGMWLLFGEPPGGGEARALDIGDCVRSADVFGPDLEILDCAEPHDAEVYAIYDLPAGTYRNDEEAGAAAREHCTDEFRRFTGAELGDSTLRALGLWDRDDTVYCLAIAPKDVHGTLLGAVP